MKRLIGKPTLAASEHRRSAQDFFVDDNAAMTRKVPTELKLIRGNPGKRRLPKNEPQPPVTCPQPPEFLSDIAKREWDRVCPRLAEVGLMTDIDVAVLAAYCGAYADLVDATRKQRGRTTVRLPSGIRRPSPFVSMIRTARADMVRYAAELGMSPAARAGLDVSVGAAPSPTKRDGGSKFNYYDDD